MVLLFYCMGVTRASCCQQQPPPVECLSPGKVLLHRSRPKDSQIWFPWLGVSITYTGSMKDQTLHQTVPHQFFHQSFIICIAVCYSCFPECLLTKNCVGNKFWNLFYSKTSQSIKLSDPSSLNTSKPPNTPTRYIHNFFTAVMPCKVSQLLRKEGCSQSDSRVWGITFIHL